MLLQVVCFYGQQSRADTNPSFARPELVNREYRQRRCLRFSSQARLCF